ncbi:phosphatidylserine/phosphatidylglycerophosphate/cardiolipin synthase family protein (plasmid) [Mycetohabitans rhizoxinica]
MSTVRTSVPSVVRSPGKDPFSSPILGNYYLAPFRPSTYKNSVLFGAGKWIKQTIIRAPRNPLKSAKFIHNLSPDYRDANELTPEQCTHFARQAYLCRAAMNQRGVYERGRDSYGATYLFEVTTLHGGYDLHSAESPHAAQRMSQVAREAAVFLRHAFPENVQAQIRKGRGSFIDRKTGLVVTFLFERQARSTKPTIHVVFSGTGAAGQTANHVAADIAILTNGGDIPPSFIQARNIVEMVQACAGDRANIEVKGFSLGGAHATYAGLANEVPTTTLSPLALSPALWKNLVDAKGERLEHLVANYVTNLTIEGDVASGHSAPSRIARVLEMSIGLQMPHILGTTYAIPANSIPENYRRPTLGLGVHSSSGRIWADFTRAKHSLERRAEAIDTAPDMGWTITDAIAAEAHNRSANPPRDPAEAEHRFLATIDKFCSKAGGFKGLGSARLHRLVNQVSRLRHRYPELTRAERLLELADIERGLSEMRNSRVVRSSITGVREMYAGVVTERNRLLEPPTQGWPIRSLMRQVSSEVSDALLQGIAEAARAGASTIGAQNVETKNNKVLSTVLRTDDEVGPAVYDLVRNAKHTVQLQTYLFYEKSESAKWLHKALDDLQARQRERRATGKTVEPVTVEVFLDDSQGLAHQDLPGDGGRLQKARVLKGRRDIPRRNAVSNYGIGYPAKLDPSLVRLTVRGLKHFDRGSLHSKTLLVDNQIALVSTNNFKGTHHKLSMDGEARFDAGVVFSGGACAAISDDLAGIAMLTRGNVLGSNEGEEQSRSDNEGAYVLPRTHYPALAGGEIKPWAWQGFNALSGQQRVDDILKKLQQFRASGLDNGKQHIVVLSKPVDRSFYSRSNDSAQRAAFLHALRNARSYIRITNVNLNVPEVIDALVDAVRRGVHVEALLPDGAMEVLSAMDAKTNFQAFYELQSRVDAMEGKSHFLDLRWQASPRGELPGKGSGADNHAKYMSVDGVAIIGSTNLDVQSWKYSAECSTAIADRKTVEMLDRDCFVDLFRYGVPFKPVLPGIAELFTNHAGPLKRRFDQRMAARLPIASSTFTGGEQPSFDRQFIKNIGSGHVFKWVSTPSSGASVNIAMRFNSRQQGYEQVKHSTVSRGESVASAGMAVLTENGDGSKTLIVNNESGHYHPSIESLAEGSPTRAKWKEVAAQLQQQLRAPVAIRFEAFTGDDAQSLEHFRGTLSKNLVNRRLSFLQRVTGDVDNAFASKLLRGEMLMYLDKIIEQISSANAQQPLRIDEQRSFRQLAIKVSRLLEQVEARQSVLTPRLRKLADLISGLSRKGANNIERPYEQLMRLRREIATLRTELAALPAQAAQSDEKTPSQAAELHRVFRVLQAYLQTYPATLSKPSRPASHG